MTRMSHAWFSSCRWSGHAYLNFWHVQARRRKSKEFDGHGREFSRNTLLLLCNAMWESQQVNRVLSVRTQGCVCFMGLLRATRRNVHLLLESCLLLHFVTFVELHYWFYFLRRKSKYKITHLYTWACLGHQDIKALKLKVAEKQKIVHYLTSSWRSVFTPVLHNCFFRQFLSFSMHLWKWFQLFSKHGWVGRRGVIAFEMVENNAVIALYLDASGCGYLFHSSAC